MDIQYFPIFQMRKLRLWDVKQLTQCKINFSYLIFSFIFFSFHLFNNYLFSFHYVPDVVLNPSYMWMGKKQKWSLYWWSYLTSDGNRILATPEMNSSLPSVSLLKLFCSFLHQNSECNRPVSVKECALSTSTWSPVDWYPSALWWQWSSPTLDILSLHRWPAESPEQRPILMWHSIFHYVPPGSHRYPHFPPPPP